MIKEFKNGNIHISFSHEEIEKIKNNNNHLYYTEILSDIIYSIDTYIIGEFFSVGNFTTAINLYNIRLDRIYTFIESQHLEKLLKGYAVTLYPQDPTCYDREVIEEYLYM